jgi:mRNA-degrading endonuclease toxin of MazEF toxin-antitoxin module
VPNPVEAGAVQRGDIVWANMNPTVGHEQAGDRPHLVLSEVRLHLTRHILLAVPLTTQARPWPTRIAVADGSWAICEQPRSLALERVRRHEPTRHDVDAVAAMVAFLIGAAE